MAMLKEGLADVQWLLSTPEHSELAQRMCPARIAPHQSKPNLSHLFRNQVAWNLPAGADRITRASMLPLLSHLSVPLKQRRGWCKASDVDNDGHVSLKELVVFVGLLTDGWMERALSIAQTLENADKWMEYITRLRLSIIFECFTYGQSAGGAIMTADMWNQLSLDAQQADGDTLPTFHELWPAAKWIEKKTFVGTLVAKEMLLEGVCSIDLGKLGSFKRPKVLYLRSATTVKLERASATRLGARLHGLNFDFPSAELIPERDEEEETNIAAATMSTSFASLFQPIPVQSHTLPLKSMLPSVPTDDTLPGSGPMPDLHVDGPAPSQRYIPKPPDDMIAPITNDYKLRLGQIASLLTPISPHKKQMPDDEFYSLHFPLSFDTIMDICDKVEAIFCAEETVLEAMGHSVVYGDLHGQYVDFLQFCHSISYPLDFMPNGNIRSCNYVFLGDYVDRGAQSLEIVCLLFLLKICYPTRIFMIRGNHEERGINADYGFLAECQARFPNGRRVWERMNQVFDWLPLACVIEKSILCVHGGIGAISNLDQIAKIPRGPGHAPCSELVDVLWSDPSEEPGLTPNDTRGTSYLYGPDIVRKFLSRNGLSLLVRAHEVQANGWTTHANGQCLTVFSATNYCGSYRNDGAVLEIFPSDTKDTREIMLQFKILGSGMLAPRRSTRISPETPSMLAPVLHCDVAEQMATLEVSHEAVGSWQLEQRPASPLREIVATKEPGKEQKEAIDAPWY